MVEACDVVADVLGVEAAEVKVSAREEATAAAAEADPGAGESLGSSKPNGPPEGFRGSELPERSKPWKKKSQLHTGKISWVTFLIFLFTFRTSIKEA